MIADAHADSRVTVDMGAPRVRPARIPFDTSGLAPLPRVQGKMASNAGWTSQPATVLVALCPWQPARRAAGADVDAAPTCINDRPAHRGPWAPPQRVNAGFWALDREHVRLRVYERGLVKPWPAARRLRRRGGGHSPGAARYACACANARRAADHRLGGQEADSVFMTGPATTVFEGQIDIPDAP